MPITNQFLFLSNNIKHDNIPIYGMILVCLILLLSLPDSIKLLAYYTMKDRFYQF